MAITLPPTYFNPELDIKFETTDHLIQGKLVVCTLSAPDIHLQQVDREYIRSELVKKIGEFLIDQKLVEFTQVRDSITYDTIVRARVFCTPDEQVRIIRTLRK